MKTLKKIGLIVGYSLLIIVCLGLTATLAAWPYAFYMEGGTVPCIVASVVTLFILVLFFFCSLDECETIIGAYCLDVFVTWIVCGILSAVYLPIFLCDGYGWIAIVFTVILVLKIFISE